MKENNALKWLNNNELSYTIWDNKYRYNNESFEDWLDRVSNNDKEVRKLIEEKKFIFGGRILANRGINDRKVSLSNCYVLTPPEDSLESIFQTAADMAKTYSYGGGVGIDLSNLRPNGAETHNAAKISSGPVSFMDLYSQVTQTISQNGRRGASMISLSVDHPDIEEFIDCKTDLNRVNYANISVRVSDSFMNAVMNNRSEYLLSYHTEEADKHPIDISELEYNKLYFIDGIYYKKINPVKLFNKLIKNNWNYAEPGILYWDTISEYNLINQSSVKYAGINPLHL